MESEHKGPLAENIVPLLRMIKPRRKKIQPEHGYHFASVWYFCLQHFFWTLQREVQV